MYALSRSAHVRTDLQPRRLGVCVIISNKLDAEVSLILKMLRPLEQRGPDACGVFVQEKLGFGHRRLSILDLTTASQQPR